MRLLIGSPAKKRSYNAWRPAWAQSAGWTQGWTQVGGTFVEEAYNDYLGNAVALSSNGSRVAMGARPGLRLERDGVGHKGVGILEGDGPHHRRQIERDHHRDRLFKAYGIRVVERCSDSECRLKPNLVVKQFLCLLKEAYN